MLFIFFFFFFFCCCYFVVVVVGKPNKFLAKMTLIWRGWVFQDMYMFSFERTSGLLCFLCWFSFYSRKLSSLRRLFCILLAKNFVVFLSFVLPEFSIEFQSHTRSSTWCDCRGTESTRNWVPVHYKAMSKFCYFHFWFGSFTEMEFHLKKTSHVAVWKATNLCDHIYWA